MSYANLTQAGINDPAALVRSCLRSGMLAVRRVKRMAAPKPSVKPRAGEHTLKQWMAQQAEVEGRSTRATYARYYRGKYPGARLRRVNDRVVFVDGKTVARFGAWAAQLAFDQAEPS